MITKFAVVGKGFIFPRHEEAIKRVGGKILMTCDNDPKKKADYLDWVEMYNSPAFREVEAVSICTPNYLHSVMTREALIRNKQVLCEKPFSIDTINGMWGAMTVLQLRKHPELKGIEPGDIYVEAKMFRDKTYWDSWKGDPAKSGGILFNLGIHYIDLMVYILANPTKILESEISPKLAKGKVEFGRFTGEYHIEIVNTKKKQGRNLTIGGKTINLSNKDNLSYEDLHAEVYEDFVIGRGPSIYEIKKALGIVYNVTQGGLNVSTLRE